MTHERKDSKENPMEQKSQTEQPSQSKPVPITGSKNAVKDEISVEVEDDVIETDLSSLVNYDSGDDSKPSNRIKYRKTLIPSSEMLVRYFPFLFSFN